MACESPLVQVFRHEHTPGPVQMRHWQHHRGTDNSSVAGMQCQRAMARLHHLCSVLVDKDAADVILV